jgi:site-specific DNA-methyltransferase (adenine-specific)
VENGLYQGDCLRLLSSVVSATVDLVFADPPFNIGYEYDVYDDEKAAEDYLAWSRKWANEIFRVLKPNGTFWLAIGDEYAADLKLMFQDIGFFCRNWVIWYYTFGVNCKKKFSRSHTHLFYFVKNQKSFTFNGDVVRVPSARQLVYADSRAHVAGKMPDDTWFLRPQDVPDGFIADHDVWYFPRVCGTFKERAGWHGCQMPEQLLGRIIKVCSNAGDIVLDPFSGSGTTLVVAKKLSRQWIGFELSENYVSQVTTRLASVQVGQSLEGAEEPKVSAPSTAHGKKLPGLHQPIVIATPRRTSSEIDKGILEAFIATRDGYSSDHVIADPELNSEFTSVCKRLGIPGEPKDWNTKLLNLRKDSRLAGLPRARDAVVDKDQADQCEFACEIAIQQFFERDGITVDRLLCDLEIASQFDNLVRNMVDAELSSVLVRSVAFRIRKRASRVREQIKKLNSFEPFPRKRELGSSLDLESVPATPGLYWLKCADSERKLYVGKTINLNRRFELQIVRSRFGFWNTPRSELDIRYRPFSEPKPENMLNGNQSHWITRWKKPEGNYYKLAAS